MAGMQAREEKQQAGSGSTAQAIHLAAEAGREVGVPAACHHVGLPIVHPQGPAEDPATRGTRKCGIHKGKLQRHADQSHRPRADRQMYVAVVALIVISALLSWRCGRSSAASPAPLTPPPRGRGGQRPLTNLMHNDAYSIHPRR